MQAKAYTVTVDVDNVYSEVIPKSFVQNAPAIFKIGRASCRERV